MSPRTVLTALLALATLVLAGLGTATVLGLSQEYGARTGLQVLAFVLAVTGLLAMATVAAWPGLSGSRAAAVVLAVLVVAAAAGLVADRVGVVLRERAAVSASEEMGCNNPNAEIAVDERVEQVWAELPRRGLLYGPIEGSRSGCTAAISGDADRNLAEYAAAFRDLDGWSVVVDRDDRFVMQRRGVRVTLAIQDDLATLTVEA